MNPDHVLISRGLVLSEIKLLIVDDDASSNAEIERLLREVELGIPVAICQNGQDALDILRARDGFAVLEHPLVVLLEIHLQGMDGHGFLDAVRSDSSLQRMFLFVLSASEDMQDIARAYDKNIVGYILKNGGAGVHRKTLEFIGTYLENIVMPASAHLKPRAPQ